MCHGRGRRGARRRRLVTSGVVIVASFALAGCGGEDSSSTGSPTTSPSSGAVLPGGGLSVAEAIATDAEPPLAVTGWLVRMGDGPRICSSYTAGAEEPCGKPSLALRGQVKQATGERISVLGSVDGDTFVVLFTVQG